MVNGLKPKVGLFPEKQEKVNDVINKDTPKKKTKKQQSNATKAGIILLAILIIVMITLALFASTDEVTNVFIAGKVDIVLTEEHWKPEDALNIVPGTELPKDPKVTNNEKVDTYVFLEVIVPYYDMRIESSNTTDNTQGSPLNGTTPYTYPDAPLYKFGCITDDNNTPDNFTDDTVEYNTYFSTPEQKVNSGWKLIPNATNSNLSYTEKDETKHVYKYVYAHVGNDDKLLPLIPGATTQHALFDNILLVNFSEKTKPSGNCNIRVNAYGIQANYLRDNNSTTNNPLEVWNMVKPAA